MKESEITREAITTFAEALLSKKEVERVNIAVRFKNGSSINFNRSNF